MKSIKEKSEEYGLQYPIIHYDADGNTYDDVDKPSIDFEAGANYVLDIIEQCLTPQKCFTEHGIDICAEALVKTTLQTIEQLKK